MLHGCTLRKQSGGMRHPKSTRLAATRRVRLGDSHPYGIGLEAQLGHRIELLSFWRNSKITFAFSIIKLTLI